MIPPGFHCGKVLDLGVPSPLRSEEAKPAAPSPKPDRAQLEAQFKKADSDRAAAKEKTKERAEAARQAMQIASDIAWPAFDAGKFTGGGGLVCEEVRN